MSDEKDLLKRAQVAISRLNEENKALKNEVRGIVCDVHSVLQEFAPGGAPNLGKIMDLIANPEAATAMMEKLNGLKALMNKYFNEDGTPKES